MALSARNRAALITLAVVAVLLFGGYLLVYSGHHVGQGGDIGQIGDATLCYVWSDRALRDSYQCAIYVRNGLTGPVDIGSACLTVRGEAIDFPDGADTVLVDGRGQLRFVAIPDECFHERRAPAIPFPFSLLQDRLERKGSPVLARLTAADSWKTEMKPFLFPDGVRRD